jgi:uncharacterized surface protein with fasciclin (FAS1) repeats
MKLTTLTSGLSATLALSLFAGSLQAAGQECSSSKATAMAPAGQGNIIETATAAGEFRTLAAALTAADLVGALQGDGPFTVFAPTDAAFAALPAGTLDMLLKPENRGLLTNILTYHVVPGKVTAAEVSRLKNATALNGQRLSIQLDEGVRVDGVNVIKTDILCTNGVIHVVDAVMMPSTKNLVETAVEAGSFKTLAAALKAAGLAETLQGKGPFTVLAPTDAAFAALPEGTVAMLLEPANKEKLVAVLTYHVIPGRVYADQLASGGVKTLQGGKVQVKLNKGKAWFNDATVVTADIDTTNGVIHVIDKVLLPE